MYLAVIVGILLLIAYSSREHLTQPSPEKLAEMKAAAAARAAALKQPCSEGEKQLVKRYRCKADGTPITDFDGKTINANTPFYMSNPAKAQCNRLIKERKCPPA
jgi:hypothetical protein